MMKTFTRLPLVAAVIAAVALAASFVVSSTTAQAAEIDTGAWYTIESRHSGLVLDIEGGSTEPGAELVQWRRTGAAGQQFRFIDAGDGHYRIQARHSGHVLDVYEWNADNGAVIAQWTDLGGTNQQWSVTESGEYVTLVNRFSGKALDVFERSTAEGARISQWTENGGANQQWRLVEVDGDEPDPGETGERPMEDLGRGVVAVRNGDDVLVTWRLLGLDPAGIGFNVYRSTDNGSWTKLNGQVLTGGTNHLDTSVDPARSNRYRVAPVVDGQEQAPSGAFTLSANHADEPAVRIPLRDGGPINFTWVGDLTGDGEYDYVVDRQTSPQSIEAYSGDGDFLWEVDMGHNSTDQNNIEGGSSTIDVGHNDGVTVYDFDSDGFAEVAVRIANGVTFGDGETFQHDNDTEQFIAVLDGRTGALRDAAQVPTDYIDDGPMYARFAACHLDGETPSLVSFMKNRVGNGGFNLMVAAWGFDGTNVDMRWKWLRGGQDAPDGHNSRCLDVDGDGTDEFLEIGFVLNGDGTLRYSMGDQGIVHGDRFHVADIDPNRPGLEGYGVQQRNPSGLLEYYYDASTGELIWEHYGSPADIGRGMAGDIDPNHPGMEVWSFSGLYNASTDRLTTDTGNAPWPQMGLWWDGDVTLELFNDGKIEQWDPQNPTPSGSLPRLESTWNYGGVVGPRGQPTLIADLLGDWREEVVLPNGSYDELIVFTTDRPTDIRLYTLAHNPAYRNDMTVKGYMQSHHVDYFLGAGMSTPPRPDITY
jgi:rhamnogalacturonan endolyase